MAKSVRIKTTDQDGSNEEIVELSFSDRDWAILERFVKYATRLENNSLVREGIPSLLRMTWAAGEGIKVEAKLPSDDQIDAMLMKLRPFILNKERTNFNKVRNIVLKANPKARIGKHLDTLQFYYSGRHQQSLFVAGVSSNDHPEGWIINSEEMLQLWLNSDRFHTDEEKERIVDAVHVVIPTETSMVLFLSLLRDKVEAILALKRLICLFTGEQEHMVAAWIPEPPIRYLIHLHPTVCTYFLDHEGDQERSTEGPWEKVFDLTELGPMTTPAFIDLVGRLWMNRHLREEIGTWHYLFQMGEGFRTPDDKVAQNGMDIVVTLRIQALLMEEPFSRDRRNPVQATLERMRRHREGLSSSSVLLRSFEAREELDHVLNQDPKPEVEWILVPRVASLFAYWPMSKGADERLRKIVIEGRQPTFAEVEGLDISRAWEIFEEGQEGASAEEDD